MAFVTFPEGHEHRQDNFEKMYLWLRKFNRNDRLATPPREQGHSFVMVMVETSASPVVGVNESTNRPSETPTRRVRVSTVR